MAKITVRMLLWGAVATMHASCGGPGSGFAQSMDAALVQVPGVVTSSTEYNTSSGMSTRINVRIMADGGAGLETVLTDSLQAFADASGDAKGTISVSYYVYAEGAEDGGIRPNAVGLKTTPTVEQIRDFAGL